MGEAMRSGRVLRGLKRGALLLLLLTGCGDDGASGGSGGSAAGGSATGGSSGTSGSVNGGGGAGASSGSASGGAGASGAAAGGSTSGGSASGSSTGGSSSGAGGSAGASGGSGGQPNADAALSAKIDGAYYAFAEATFGPQAANEGTYDILGEQGGTSLISLELSLQANGPGSYQCGNTSLTFYDQGGKAFHAVASDGSCSIEVTAWPAARGDYFDATFTATLVRTGETPKMLTEGIAHVLY